MRLIPPTPAFCLLNLVVGVLLIATSWWALATANVRIPVLEVVVIVAAAGMVVCSIIGLASPRLRGR